MSTPLHQTQINPKEAADVLRDFADRVESGKLVITDIGAGYEREPIEYSSLTINFTRKREASSHE